MFLLPKQTNYEIEKKIRQFLWAGNAETHRSHKVAWKVVCSPKQEGGLGLLDLKLWNKVLLARILWSLMRHPPSSLWSTWVHHIKCRGTPIMQLDIKGSMAWSWRYILRLRLALSPIISSQTYCCKEIYNELRQEGPPVDWYHLIWTSGISKHNFISWLVCRDRLPTTVAISRWLPSVDTKCNFCMTGIENKTHLFLECSWTSSIWRSILAQNGIWCSAGDRNFELQWMIRATKGKNLEVRLLKLSFLATIYCIWMERNRRRFQSKSLEAHLLLAKIRKVIRGRASFYQNCRFSQANVLLATVWRLPSSIFLHN